MRKNFGHTCAVIIHSLTLFSVDHYSHFSIKFKHIAGYLSIQEHRIWPYLAIRNSNCWFETCLPVFHEIPTSGGVRPGENRTRTKGGAAWFVQTHAVCILKKFNFSTEDNDRTEGNACAPPSLTGVTNYRKEPESTAKNRKVLNYHKKCNLTLAMSPTCYGNNTLLNGRNYFS